MLAILASSLVILVAATILGRAFLLALGRTRPTWMAAAIGFATLTVTSPLLIHLPGRATTATIVTALAVLVCAATMRRRFFAAANTRPGRDGAGAGTGPDEHGGTADPGTQAESRSAGHVPVPARRAAHTTALATVLITFVLACVPFALNDSTGVLGEGVYTNDQAAQLYWTDWLQHGTGPEPSAVKFGYPTGPQSVAALAATSTGASLEHAFNGLLIVIPVLGALAALSALGGVEPRRRVAAAVLAGLPYLGASYLAQSAFKETAMALFVLALAVVLGELERGEVTRRAGVGAIVALAGASVFTYSLPGLAWFAGAIAVWLALELVRGNGRVRADVAGAAGAVRRHRRAVAIGAVILLAVVAAGAGPVSHFSSKIGDVQSSPGRLGSPISPGEAFGVWPQGDFRIVRGDVTGSLPAIALGFIAVALGALALLRRRSNGLLAGLGAGFVIYVATRIDASDYVQAKALAVIAPTVVLVALLGLWEPREVGNGRPRWAVGLGVVFALCALGSTLLALRSAPVGFDNRAHDLESLAKQIQGRSVVFLGLDRFAAYWLRGTLIQAPGGYVPPDISARHDKPWEQGEPVDFDSISPDHLDRFDYAITTTAAFQSSPPPNVRVVDRSGDYVLWKRTGQTPSLRILPEGLSPGQTLDCSSPEGRQIAEQPGTATILPKPVTGPPEAWGSSGVFDAPGSASQTLKLGRGHWRLSLQYNSQVELHVSAPSLSTKLPPSLDGMYFTHPGQGAFWPAGELVLREPAAVTVRVSGADPPALSRLSGATRRVWLGNIAASPTIASQARPLAKACGAYVDHYTLTTKPQNSRVHTSRKQP